MTKPNKRRLKRKLISKIKSIFRYGKYSKKNKALNIIKQKPRYVISIKITPNNIFCNFKNIRTRKTLILMSAGIIKIKISKKKIKFACRIIITKFVNNIRRKIKNKITIIKLSGPSKIKKIIFKQLIRGLKGNKLILYLDTKKCFNGCRPKKKKRKKRKGMRVLK